MLQLRPTPTQAAELGAGGVGNGKKRGRPRQEGSWASDRQRTDVKRGKFSEKEKDTIRSAVKECAARISCRALDCPNDTPFHVLAPCMRHIPLLSCTFVLT